MGFSLGNFLKVATLGLRSKLEIIAVATRTHIVLDKKVLVNSRVNTVSRRDLSIRSLCPRTEGQICDVCLMVHIRDH